MAQANFGGARGTGPGLARQQLDRLLHKAQLSPIDVRSDRPRHYELYTAFMVVSFIVKASRRRTSLYSIPKTANPLFQVDNARSENGSMLLTTIRTLGAWAG